MRKIILGLLAVLPLSLSANAMTTRITAPAADAPAITLVSGGCGIHFHRDPSGVCLPNGYIVPGAYVVPGLVPALVAAPGLVVGDGCAPGYHLGPFGVRCRPNY